MSEIAKTSDIPAQYVHPANIQCNASTEIDYLKSSVSNGKTLIANAITGKGVATSSSDTFATMANNINQISEEVLFVTLEGFGTDVTIDTTQWFGKPVKTWAVFVTSKSRPQFMWAAWYDGYDGQTNCPITGMEIYVNGNYVYLTAESAYSAYCTILAI